MRLLIICGIFILISTTCVFSVESDNAAAVLQEVAEKTAPEYEWIRVMTPNTASIATILKEIDEQTPERSIKIKIEEILVKMELMRGQLREHDVNMESFSLNVGFPPSLTINCRFKQ